MDPLARGDSDDTIEPRSHASHRRHQSRRRLFLEPVVRLARATRFHPRVRRGASVRAAVAIADLAVQLDGDVDRAAGLALPTRIELFDPRETRFSHLLDDLKKKTTHP